MECLGLCLLGSADDVPNVLANPATFFLHALTSPISNNNG